MEETHLVCSGVVVGGLCQPSRFEIRWTVEREEERIRNGRREEKSPEKADRGRRLLFPPVESESAGIPLQRNRRTFWPIAWRKSWRKEGVEDTEK